MLRTDTSTNTATRKTAATELPPADVVEPWKLTHNARAFAITLRVIVDAHSDGSVEAAAGWPCYMPDGYEGDCVVPDMVEGYWGEPHDSRSVAVHSIQLPSADAVPTYSDVVATVAHLVPAPDFEVRGVCTHSASPVPITDTTGWQRVLTRYSHDAPNRYKNQVADTFKMVKAKFEAAVQPGTTNAEEATLAALGMWELASTKDNHHTFHRQLVDTFSCQLLDGGTSSFGLRRLTGLQAVANTLCHLASNVGARHRLDPVQLLRGIHHSVTTVLLPAGRHAQAMDTSSSLATLVAWLTMDTAARDTAVLSAPGFATLQALLTCPGRGAASITLSAVIRCLVAKPRDALMLLAGCGSGLGAFENACRKDAVFTDVVMVAQTLAWLSNHAYVVTAHLFGRREVALLLAMWNMQDVASSGKTNMLTPHIDNRRGMTALRRAIVAGMWGATDTLVARLRHSTTRVTAIQGKPHPEQETLDQGAKPLYVSWLHSREGTFSYSQRLVYVLLFMA